MVNRSPWGQVISLSVANRAPAAWIVAALLSAAGCGQANTFAPPPPPEVTVARPVRRTVTNYLEVTGTTQPLLSVEIRARVKGFLKERHFKEGSIVKKGALLLVIDEEGFQVSLDEARTRLEEAEASLLKAKQSRAREVARAQLALDESQLRLARLAEARQRNLASRHASTQEEIDQAEASRKKSEAQVEASRAHLEQAVADYETNITSAAATVGTMRTAVKNATIELGYCRMFAPIDGRITRVNIHEGNLVGDAQSSLLATIVKIDPIYAYINVNELDLPRFHQHGGEPGPPSGAKGAVRMELALAEETGYPHIGYADYQDPSLDAGTGTLRVRGVFDNPQSSIMPGLFVRVRIPLDRKPDALLVPERALGTDQSGAYLLVVSQDDVVEYRPVKAGARIDEMRVVEGQIGPADRVVVDGLLRARPKLKVNPQFETTTQGIARAD
jgi:RND family efflux transporter MFP subunit